MKELNAIALASKSSTNLPLPPETAFELLTVSAAHHAKQDSWPMVSNGFNARSNSVSSSASLSGGSHRQQNTKSAMLPNKIGDLTTVLFGNSTTPAAPTISSCQPYPEEYEGQHSYSAKPYTVMSQSPSLSSLTTMINSASNNCPSSTCASVRHSIASCSTTAQHLLNGSSPVAPSAQIARSQRVQQAARQELCMPAPKQRLSLETSLDDITDARSEDKSDLMALPAPPPPLPPKNVNSNSPTYSPSTSVGVKGRAKSSSEQALTSSEIKAIQKRAVYEFYLRQKEKKEKAKLCSPPESPSKNNNSGSLSASISASSTAFASLSSEFTLAKVITALSNYYSPI